MRLCKILTLVAVLLTFGKAYGQTDYYFDVNDEDAESGVVSDTVYDWNNSAPSWNLNADGSGPSPGTTVTWQNGNNAIFSAGTDAIGAMYGIRVAGGTSANYALIQDGYVVVTSGFIDTGAGITEVAAGATLQLNDIGQLNGGGVIKLSGGELVLARDNTVAFSPIPSGKSVEINGTGIITKPNKGTGGGAVVIFGAANTTNVILGTGGTTTNGGAGMLIKRGPHEFRHQNSSTALSTFAKLRVEEGLFRLGSVIPTGQPQQTTELGFGAAPLAPLADAITIDGGEIGSSFSVTLHANRGITVGPNGGGINGNGSGVLTVPGPLSGNGLLNIFGINLTTTSAGFGNNFGGLVLGNAGNNTSFTGSVQLDSSTLTLNESLSIKSLNGGSVTSTGGTAAQKGATVTGTVSVASGKTVTIGTDGSDSTYSGRITGAGAITKVGAGTFILNTINSTTTNSSDVVTVFYTGEFTNTGGVNINEGTIRFGTSSSGFTNTATATGVTIAAPGTLDMNGINDTFPTLSGAGTVKMDGGGSTAGNLTLNGTAAGPFTFSGTITKNSATTGGNLTKSGAGSRHILSGSVNVNALAANAGTLELNGSTTASGGATVAAAGTLAGTGTLTAALTNNGTLAPGSAGVGTLNLVGNLVNTATAKWDIELSGTTADKLAVTGNIDLSAVGDSLNVSGTGTGSSWLIGTYTGTLSGVFDTITSGYSVSYTGGNIMLTAAAGLPGDFNTDGKVDAADYVTWRKSGTNPLPNDNGAVDAAARYTVWRQNFGNPPGAGSGSGLEAGGTVPEPASFGLVLIGLAAFGFGRRSRTA